MTHDLKKTSEGTAYYTVYVFNINSVSESDDIFS